jgi:hypothetical protein
MNTAVVRVSFGTFWEFGTTADPVTEPGKIPQTVPIKQTQRGKDPDEEKGQTQLVLVNRLHGDQKDNTDDHDCTHHSKGSTRPYTAPGFPRITHAESILFISLLLGVSVSFLIMGGDKSPRVVMIEEINYRRYCWYLLLPSLSRLAGAWVVLPANSSICIPVDRI